MAETAENDGGGVAQVGLAAIFAAFFRLGCTAFGGGTAGWIHREVVLRQRWVDDRTFLAALGVGQALPGANGIKAAVLIGMRLHGIVGALCAFVALLAGPLAIVIALAAAYGGLGGQSLPPRAACPLPPAAAASCAARRALPPTPLPARRCCASAYCAGRSCR